MRRVVCGDPAANKTYGDIDCEGSTACDAATGLAANTTYHYRVSATNSGGTSKGGDVTFKTS